MNGLMSCVSRGSLRLAVPMVISAVAVSWGDQAVACLILIDRNAPPPPTLVEYVLSGEPVLLVRLSPVRTDSTPEPSPGTAARSADHLAGTEGAQKSPGSVDRPMTVRDRFLSQKQQLSKLPSFDRTGHYCNMEIIDAINYQIKQKIYPIYYGRIVCPTEIGCSNQIIALPIDPERLEKKLTIRFTELHWTDVEQWPEAVKAATETAAPR